MPKGPNWRSRIAQPVEPAAGDGAGRAARAESRAALRRAEGRRHRRGCSRRSARPTAGSISSSTRSPSPRRRSCASPTSQMSRAGWHLAMDISVYSLVAVCRAAAPLMTDGGAILTISYYGGEKVVPGYNVMGVCKAALEHSVRYLAWDLGRQKIRVNCISAGPMRTLSAAGISGLRRAARARRQEIAAGPQRRPRRTSAPPASICSAIFPAA